MKKCYLIFFLVLFTTTAMQAQTFPGYRTSNYTGVNGVFFNPANIADNRFKWDVNVFAINGFVGTDQSGLRFRDITRSFNADSLKSKLLRGNDHLNSLSYVDVLGPSVMFSLSPKTSLAFTTRSRVFANGSDINGNLANALLDGGKTTAGLPFTFNNNMLVHTTGWTEIGGSVGQVLTPKGSRHFFKGGLTLKYIAGTADSYLSTNGFSGTVNGAGNAYLTGTTGSLSLNTTAANFGDYNFSDFFKFNGHGFGGDIGFVYELRTSEDYSMYETDRFANKYKLKISASLLDVGRISFDRSGNQAANYAVNIPPGATFGLDQFEDMMGVAVKSVIGVMVCVGARDVTVGDASTTAVVARAVGDSWMSVAVAVGTAVSVAGIPRLGVADGTAARVWATAVLMRFRSGTGWPGTQAWTARSSTDPSTNLRMFFGIFASFPSATTEVA